MTPEEYIEELRAAQRTLDMVKEDLDSRLAALAGREYVKLADDQLLKVGTAKIEY